MYHAQLLCKDETAQCKSTTPLAREILQGWRFAFYIVAALAAVAAATNLLLGIDPRPKSTYVRY